MSEKQGLQNYFELLLDFDNEKNPVAIDLAHNLLMMGALLSRKPHQILEIGIGTGYVTRSLLCGISYNRRGELTSIDNHTDWGKKEPPELFESLRSAGANIISPVDEGEFVKTCESDKFDFIISDGDHVNSGLWIDEIFRIGKADAFLFFHDTNANMENMQKAVARIEQLGLPHYHFTDQSRDDERCARGWMFVINRKLGMRERIYRRLRNIRRRLRKRSWMVGMLGVGFLPPGPFLH